MSKLVASITKINNKNLYMDVHAKWENKKLVDGEVRPYISERYSRDKEVVLQATTPEVIENALENLNRSVLIITKASKITSIQEVPKHLY